MVTLEQEINGLILQGNNRRREIKIEIARLEKEYEVINEHLDDLEHLRNKLLEEKASK
jgi:hypothetical protein